jgi:hypothetical protein
MGSNSSSNAPDAGSADDPTLQIRIVTSIEQVDREAWDGLGHAPSPFLEYGFLRALEASRSIGKGSGWHPFYLLAEIVPEEHEGDASGQRLIGAVAAFVKSHSYGEYIFDWSWAGAAERAGIPYYPKLVVAAPVTPATGARVLLAADADADYVTAALVTGVKLLADEAECSSIHWLFTTYSEQQRLVELGFAARTTYQFHWHNQGYADFDEFLGRLKSRKRKQVRKERRRALEGIDAVDFVPGTAMSTDDTKRLDRFYRNTTFAHGGMDYLRPGFFHALVEHLPERTLFARARRGSSTVAGALYLETEHGLYGRYWGCSGHSEFLHFEVAYYAGIQRCIERGIPLFEAGAQGEHKLLRGFVPNETYSAHWIREPRLREAIFMHLEEDSLSTRHRMERLAEYGPYRSEE